MFLENRTTKERASPAEPTDGSHRQSDTVGMRLLLGCGSKCTANTRALTGSVILLVYGAPSLQEMW